jgi:DNA polymerase III epsilon subunit
MQLAFSLDEYIVFDLETTGLSPLSGDEIIEIGAVKIFGDQIDEQSVFHTLVNPRRRISDEAMKINGITNEMVADAPTLDQVFPKFLEFVGDGHLIAQNAKFDMGFIMKALMNYKIKRNLKVWDTITFSKRIFPTENRHNLDIICQRLGIQVDNSKRHRSIEDVNLTAKAFLIMKERLGNFCPPPEKWNS